MGRKNRAQAARARAGKNGSGSLHLGQPAMYWQKRAQRLNRRARAAGAEGRVSPDDLRKVAAAARGSCHWCGCGVQWSPNAPEHLVATFDHVTALADGGTNAAFNLVVSCKRCNGSRGSVTGGAQRALDTPETADVDVSGDGAAVHDVVSSRD